MTTRNVPAHKRANHSDRMPNHSDPYGGLLPLVTEYGRACRQSERAWADCDLSSTEALDADERANEAYARICRAILDALESAR